MCFSDIMNIRPLSLVKYIGKIPGPSDPKVNPTESAPVSLPGSSLEPVPTLVSVPDQSDMSAMNISAQMANLSTSIQEAILSDLVAGLLTPPRESILVVQVSFAKTSRKGKEKVSEPKSVPVKAKDS